MYRKIDASAMHRCLFSIFLFMITCRCNKYYLGIVP